jgi:uroporphyrinogen decarboxylase
MNKRDAVLNLAQRGHQAGAGAGGQDGYTPAAFFLHFDEAFHRGDAAVAKHLEFFHATGMDFVKIQYEQRQPPHAPIVDAEDWTAMPLYGHEFFEEPAYIVRGLVAAAQRDALVIMTLYSPLMWALRLTDPATMRRHLEEDPEAVALGLEIMTENVSRLVAACKRAGVDGFYVSTQGGETFRFSGTDYFRTHIKPTDLAVWDAIGRTPCNILHVCDYQGPYDDLTPFIDYPGDIVNCSLEVGDRTLTPQEAAALFRRPFMGGMQRKGVLATGPEPAIRTAAAELLAAAPGGFLLAADCTVPAETPWSHLAAAIQTAHGA